MKRLTLILLLFGIFLLIGCAQPEVSQPQQVAEDQPVEEVQQVVEEVESEPAIEQEPEKPTQEPREAVTQEPEPVPEPQAREFIIEADDRGFYPNSIEIDEGETVVITFKVRGEGTYFGGLDFRSDAWGDTGKIPPGEQTTVEFVAEETVPFDSFWPASNALKASGEVIVNQR